MRDCFDDTDIRLMGDDTGDVIVLQAGGFQGSIMPTAKTTIGAR